MSECFELRFGEIGFPGMELIHTGEMRDNEDARRVYGAQLKLQHQGGQKLVPISQSFQRKILSEVISDLVECLQTVF